MSHKLGMLPFTGLREQIQDNVIARTVGSV